MRIALKGIIPLIVMASFFGCRKESDKSLENDTMDSISARADTVTNPVFRMPVKAGDTIPQEYVRLNGIDEFFTVVEIDSALEKRISGKSYNSDTPVPLDELRYLTVAHIDGKGVTRMGEIICNKAIADKLIQIFRTLYDKAYPIESVRLVDDFDGDDEASMTANNTSCFNTRPRTGQRQQSLHSYGMAIDINPLYNPLVKERNGTLIVEPSTAADYVDRTHPFPYKIEKGDACHKAFAENGFRWGGAWQRSKDYQHFEMLRY